MERLRVTDNEDSMRLLYIIYSLKGTIMYIPVLR